MGITAHTAGSTGNLPPPRLAEDLRGIAQLLVQAVTATTDLAENVHANVLGLPARLLGAEATTRTRGIAGFAYGAVRGGASLLGGAVDGVLAPLADRWPQGAGSARRDALLAALNGVLGDQLTTNGNPLALAASLRHAGQTLPIGEPRWASALSSPSPRLLVQVHGLCMNDRQWRRNGHDHGEQLAEALGYTAIHLHYNSGLPIARNGRTFSALLQQMLDGWPVPVERFAILGHSMGGLVTRAAMHEATLRSQPWVRRLDQVVFLGTPHHGAPLERVGHLLEQALGLSAWTAPFVRIGDLRSAGIRDLRHGSISDHPLPPRQTIPLPDGVRAYAVAGSSGSTTRIGRALRGDGLVPVASALGEHRDPRRRLAIAPARQRVVEGTGHLDLLGSQEVYSHLRRWLA
ncbi:alpha/beta hydrolase [Thermomonas fusca]|uniref:Alpha/beta hydrolase n=1 Tax=Thermomonas fusca TaxID=215690 RepID=A0A5R9PF69_9GAMM|nr:alpha/beta hydrolase [Thermomonas fusca]TLX21250.1 alpha/beta hydrolase [Thermomonas fusca]